MYELVNVIFPFTTDSEKGKLRPGFIISPSYGKHKQVIIAYVTTKISDILPTDILLDPKKPYFSSTGLTRKLVIKLHRLSTFQPESLQEGDGVLSQKIVNEMKKKLLKVFQLK